MRRYTQQQPEMVPGRTRPLDAWYAHTLDPAKPPADKPRYTGDQKLLRLVDGVTALRTPGWLSTAALLLEGSAKAQRTFGRYAARLAGDVKRDRQYHMLTWLTADSTDRPCVLVWVCAGLDEPDEDLEQELTDYLAAKKYQVKAYRAACMVSTCAPSNFRGSSSTTGSTIMTKNWSGERSIWYHPAARPARRESGPGFLVGIEGHRHREAARLRSGPPAH